MLPDTVANIRHGFFSMDSVAAGDERDSSSFKIFKVSKGRIYQIWWYVIVYETFHNFDLADSLQRAGGITSCQRMSCEQILGKAFVFVCCFSDVYNISGGSSGDHEYV